MQSDSRTLSIRLAPNSSLSSSSSSNSSSGGIINGIGIGGYFEQLLTVYLHIEKSGPTSNGILSGKTGGIDLKCWSDQHFDRIGKILVEQLAENFMEILINYQYSVKEVQIRSETEKLNVFLIDSSTNEEEECAEDVGLLLYKVTRCNPLNIRTLVSDGSRLSALPNAPFALDVWPYPRSLQREVLAAVSMLG